jgi:hypothetical protein
VHPEKREIVIQIQIIANLGVFIASCESKKQGRGTESVKEMEREKTRRRNDERERERERQFVPLANKRRRRCKNGEIFQTGCYNQQDYYGR